MSNIYNTNYYQPMMGSLTGFTSIDLPTTNPNPLVTGWSIEQLRAYLLNLDQQNFPSKDWLIEIDGEITTHVNNLSNPHQVTLAQINSNYVENIMGSLVPGTPPQQQPFFSFYPALELPLGTMVPVTNSTTNLYRLNDSGQFVDPNSEPNYIGTDFILGFGALPLYANVTNLVVSNWPYQIGGTINTTYTSTLNHAYCPGTLFNIFEEADNGTFGVMIPTSPLDGSTLYTTTLFLLGTTNPGFVIIQQPSNSVDFINLSLVDGTFTTSTDAMVVESIMYPNGVIRVSFSYMTSTTPDNAIQVLFYDSYLPIGDRNGVNNRPIFSISTPVTSGGHHLGHPIPINQTLPAVMNGLSINSNSVISTPTLSNVMITLSLYLTTLPPNPGTVDTPTFFTFGALSLNRDHTNVYLNINGNVVAQSPIVLGINNFAISYSPTTVIFKDSFNPRQTVSGAYAPLSTSNIGMGPAWGYLISNTLYAISDNNECVEFLVNV